MHPFKDYPGGDKIRPLNELAVEGQRVFLRVDFNVPIKEGVIGDDTRIRAALPTIQYLISKGAKVICASHLGRPKNGPDPLLSLEPIAERLGQLLNMDVLFSDDSVGNAVVSQTKTLKNSQVMVIENLRFYPGEEGNSPDYIYKLSQLCDVYVNDAFGTCHRAHASTAGLPLTLKLKAPGLLMEKEVQALSQLVHNPDRPLVSILGGSKVSDKVKVIDALMVKSSKILIGGAMAYTFLRALKIKTGSSRVETDKITLAEKLLERSKNNNCKIILPMDHVMGKTFDNPGLPQISENTHIPDDLMGMDIGPRTRELFKKELQGARSIFWNGPLGVFEKAPFDEGTNFIAHLIAEAPATTKICGGGDSVAAINKTGVADKFTHISTGGGASLEMIEGLAMPGIEALKLQNY